MEKLSLKEKLVFGFIFNEKRVYQHWYTRFYDCWRRKKSRIIRV